MEDIRSVLSQFNSKKKRDGEAVQKASVGPAKTASSSEIPDVFFDVVLQKYKLNRHEISLLMILYRQVWCRPNLYKSHGIGPLNSYSELCANLAISSEELGTYLRTLENYGFIETVRSGQYFVRKYFTEVLDLQYGQDYDEFF
jgi:DNA-binding MarR family transcriptional regulator